MGFTLRPYQSELIDQARARMLKGVRSLLIVSPTGSGKTALTAHMLGTASSRGMASWFVVHRRELVRQSIRAFAEVGVKYSVIAPGYDEEPLAHVQIGSVQTVARRYKRLARPKLIIWDECHHIAAGSWSEIYAAFPDAFHIGLTATPQRLDGTGLGRWFSEMLLGPSVEWLIENKFLSPYRLFAPASLNMNGVHSRMGDFVRSELADIVNKPTITGDAIRTYQQHAAGKRAVVFCVSIEHSKYVTSQFQAAGIAAAHVDGESPAEERDRIIKGFEDGRIKVLSNVDLFGEGFDVPCIEAVLLLRPTQSLGLYLQQVGRSLRTAPGKTHAIILDHAGNCERHGLPDFERQWSLRNGSEREKAEQDGPAVKICPKCFAAQLPGRPACSYCGAVFEKKARAVEHVEGELVEVDTAKIRADRDVHAGADSSMADLVKIAKSRGHKNPYRWAQHVFQTRQAFKLKRGRAE